MLEHGYARQQFACAVQELDRKGLLAALEAVNLEHHIRLYDFPSPAMGKNFASRWTRFFDQFWATPGKNWQEILSEMNESEQHEVVELIKSLAGDLRVSDA